MDYLWDLCRFLKDWILQWINLLGGIVGVLWWVFERSRGKELSVKTFFVIIAICLFFAAFGAWREQYLKSRSSLMMSVIRYGFDATTNELSADVQFVNKGTIRRTVLGVTFTHRSKNEDGQSQNLLIRSGSPYAGFYDRTSPPLYVEPGQPEVRTYKYALEADKIGLAKKPGEVFGLQIVSLTPDSEMSITTVEAMMVVEYEFGDQRGTALTSLSKTNISLDTHSYSKMDEHQLMLPSPAPSKEPSPH